MSGKYIIELNLLFVNTNNKERRREVLYENVKTLCERKGMSIKELEERAEIGNGTVGKWAKGVQPNLAILYKVADVLGVKVATLLKD